MDEGRISASSDVAVQFFGVDRSTVGKNDLLLFDEEGPVGGKCTSFEFWSGQLPDMFIDDLFGYLRGYVFINNIFLAFHFDRNQRSATAGSHAARCDSLDLSLQSVGLDGLFKASCTASPPEDMQGVLAQQRSRQRNFCCRSSSLWANA